MHLRGLGLVTSDAFTVVSALSLLDDVEGLREKLIVLTSPSKCFNIATTNIATAIIPNASLRRRFAACGRDAAEVTPFGYAAAAAAYGDAECEAWRQRMVTYIRANRDYAADALEAMGIRCVRPEASYLMWMDATDALPPGTNAEKFFLDEAAVGLGSAAGDAQPPAPAPPDRFHVERAEAFHRGNQRRRVVGLVRCSEWDGFGIARAVGAGVAAARAGGGWQRQRLARVERHEEQRLEGLR